MMGYNEVANQELNLGDPFKGGRNKLRPLVPRPYLSPPNHDVHASRPTNHLLSSSLNTTTTRHHHHHHHHTLGGGGAEEGKAEAVGPNQVMVTSRWNPTPEQLRALEELYRRGTRTPSADQIQHITSQLRRYGKIEGKNVFYWFQNHKARERQKRRRHSHPSSGNGTGGNKMGVETEQKSCKWAPSSTNKESDPPTQIAETGVTKAENTAATSSEYGWIQFHETPHQFQHTHKTNNNNSSNNNNNNSTTIHNNISSIKNLLLFAGERNATWQTENNTMVQTSSCSCCYPSLFPFSLSSSKPINSSSSIIMPKDLNQLPVKPVVYGDDHGEAPQSPTLQLFPVVHVREDDQHNHNHNSSLDYDNDDDDDDDDGDDDEMKRVEKEESEHITSNEKVYMNNNPFPYYQFL